MLSPPPHLSPSSINTFLQCPLKFKFGKIDGIMEPPTVHTLLGNFVHDILENLYQLPSDERNLDAARRLAREAWHDKYEFETKSIRIPGQEFRWKAWWCVENLWKIEEPSLQSFEGIESEVYGKVEGVTIKGFIDRFARLEDGSIVIEDYKTGKVPNLNYLDDKFFQLFIYAVMLQELNIGTASKITLIYLTAPKVLTWEVTEEKLNKTINTITSTKKQIDTFCEQGSFPAKTSGLCNFCFFKSSCPAWKR
jgi:putative RecB family exonuclease